MKIVCISDTHNRHRSIHLPDGDMLVHAGDFSVRGNESEFFDFVSWFAQQPHKHKVFIPGNHDGFVEENLHFAKQHINSLPSKVHFLVDESVEINGIKIYGSPWTPTFYDWWFMKNRGKEIKQVWDQIPEDTDILVTHGPPATVLDVVPHAYGYDHTGCVDLMNKISNLPNLKLSIFGHIHEAAGALKKVVNGRAVTFINAALGYSLENPVRIIDLGL